MSSGIAIPVAAGAAGAALGAAVRFATSSAFDGEPVLMAAIGLVGWFVVGVVGGLGWSTGPWLRALLLALACLGFTSLPQLFTSAAGGGAVIVALLEVAFGLCCAGLGLLAVFWFRAVQA